MSRYIYQLDEYNEYYNPGSTCVTVYEEYDSFNEDEYNEWLEDFCYDTAKKHWYSGYKFYIYDNDPKIIDKFYDKFYKMMTDDYSDDNYEYLANIYYS